METQRQLYNAALEERIGAYQKAGKTITYFDQARSLTELRQNDADFSRLPVSLQRGTLARLEIAYQSFYRRLKAGSKPGFPRFRGRGRFHTLQFQQFTGVTLRKGRLRFKGMPGTLRVHWHRQLPANACIRSCAIKRDTKGWNLSLAIEVSAAACREPIRAVGVDLGIANFAVLSDGGFIPSLNATRRAESQMRKAQRSLQRRRRGSRSWRKARSVVARCHAAVARRRAEHLHQASARLVRDYDVVAVERLNVKALANGVFAKDVHDASWGRFIAMLRYKAEWAGTRLIEVDAAGTSQDCSACGTKVPKRLGERVHDCPRCGLLMDRDLNAARNVLNRAGVGPSLHNVADESMRAGENLTG